MQQGRLMCSVDGDGGALTLYVTAAEGATRACASGARQTKGAARRRPSPQRSSSSSPCNARITESSRAKPQKQQRWPQRSAAARAHASAAVCIHTTHKHTLSAASMAATQTKLHTTPTLATPRPRDRALVPRCHRPLLLTVERSADRLSDSAPPTHPATHKSITCTQQIMQRVVSHRCVA